MYQNYKLKFFKYFIEDKKSISNYLILSCIVGVLELIGIALTYPFILKLLSENKFNKESAIIACAIILAFIVKNILMILYTVLQTDFTKKTETKISKMFLKIFIYGNYNSISKIPYAQKSQIIGFLVPRAVNNYLIRILNLVVNIFIFGLIIALLFFKFFLATAVTLVCATIFLTTQSLFFKNKTTTLSQKASTANKDLSLSIQEPVLNIKTVKIAHQEKFFYERYCSKLDIFAEISKKLQIYNTIPTYITEPFIIILLFILLSIITYQNYDNSTVLIASYALLASAIFRLAPIISRIQVNITGICATLPQVKELVEHYENLKDSAFYQHTEETLTKINTSIELKNVTFAYDTSIILNNINLKINKGEFVGIAGASGVGKTTLIDIITGLLTPSSGLILFDNKTIDYKTTPKLSIGYVPQEFIVINSSIRENIALGEKDIDDSRVVEVLKAAELYDYVITTFKDGIYSKPFVDSNGFSQGQKQRLAIARALYRNPDIIVLDEATSALDLKTEDNICNVLENLKGEKTIITIAHRISTLKNTDKIFFLKNSTISSSGTFNELYENNSDFQHLVNLNQANLIH